MDDEQIAKALETLAANGFEDVPHEGEWLHPPYLNDASGRAIVLNDSDFQFVVVDRTSGAVYSCCEDDETLMASSLSKLTQIAQLWGSIDRDDVGPAEDEDFARVVTSFEAELKRIDPAAAKPSEFWPLYVEEISSAEL